MLAVVSQLPYPIQALLATLITWGITALGAAVVFFIRKPNRNFMDAMLGLAGGVMVAASFWSLLSPSIEMSGELGLNPWLIALVGFLGGGVLLFLGDRFFTRLQARRALLTQIGLSVDPRGRKRSALLLFSITLHNIPEGMAIGVAFGSVAYGLEGSTLMSAWVLALGIGLQNLPEGMAVSVPLRREGCTRRQAFFYGQISGIAEPIAGFLGALLVLKVHTCLPFLLAFAAGAMIYVVVEELIPESQTNENKDWMALFTLVGFSIMMVLDVALG
ncbi:MAG: ZIP family metal transporter [Bacillota bacterium]|nr:ZIP family metal transporter [Bacillota bacterium]